MNNFRNFDLAKTGEFFITRHKWFSPYYELTDGQFVYGKLSLKTFLKQCAIIETAQGQWTINKKGWLSRTLLINSGDENIGTVVPEVWKRNAALKLNGGFEATYYQSKKFYCDSLTLSSTGYGDILQVKAKIWSFKKPFIITVEQTE
jgi:hypothetical protein